MAKKTLGDAGCIQEMVIEISNLLDHRKSEIEFISNFYLIKLFWQIGKEIGKLNNADFSPEKAHIAFRKIEEVLINKYGHFFKSYHLHEMDLFARIFSNEDLINRIAYYLDWPLISVMLQLKTEQQWTSFIMDAIEAKMSRAALLSANTLPQKESLEMHTSSDKAIDQEKLLSLFPTKFYNGKKRHIDSLYTGHYRYEFKELLGVHTTSGNPGIGVGNLELNILKLIDAFKCSLSREVNSMFNVSFWDVGRLLDKRLNAIKSQTDRQGYLEEFSLVFEQKWGAKIGCGSNIYSMLCYYQILGETDMAFQVACLVNWEQLQELFHLHDPEMIHLCARMLARGDIDLFSIRQYISHGFPEEVLNQERALLQMLTPPNTPSEIVHTERKGNSIITIKERILKTDEDIINKQFYVDVFSNTFFTEFMKSGIKA
ncbi:DUF1016 N-terminal domain-containing protein [Filimonas effusa]|uniref:DUF1016 family protein n=1 Tax=Filimonas effusa TaxID=2508721 RepID=A0A4Q1D7Q5_9BACT|nr:DUF1016 family protein [Filimonas effusa]RXK85312.1 DUF1016 family protein [Filimonas effusa]